MTRFILVLMIRNEEKIITRCIERAVASTTIDAILIYDTGSNDSTLEQVNACKAKTEIPIRVYDSSNNREFENFGKNRTISFELCCEFCDELQWPREKTYALVLDADMLFVNALPRDLIEIEKASFNEPGYQIEQRSGHLVYRNVRFLQLSKSWRCTGVTHEYWDGYATNTTRAFYIEDVGDGGCKGDKFQRDERLLSKGLLEEPGNVRYMFYLAQTLQNLKRLPEAIALYRQRVRAGGWFQEIWYSCYQISRLYRELEDYPRMEYWGQRASVVDCERAENLCFLAQIFRERSQHHKAWHYMRQGKMGLPHDKLFLDTSLYAKGLLYEKTILNYYVQPLQREENLRDLIEYCNKHDDLAYSNLQHYVDPIDSLWRKELKFEDRGNYVASSVSFTDRKATDNYCLNVRYVNYRIRPDGSYDVRGDSVDTRNVMHKASRSFDLDGSSGMEMERDWKPTLQVTITGIEDLRLVGEVFTGASMEYSGTIQQVSGKYDAVDGLLLDVSLIESPAGASCEKNWVHFDGDTYIYRWHPFEIGKFQNGKLQIETSQKTPKFFAHVRGSSNAARFGDFYYAIVHVVQYTVPRKYYHMIVKIGENRAILSASNPFYFFNNAIEYVLSCDISQGHLLTVVSQNDANPVALAIDLMKLKFYDLD